MRTLRYLLITFAVMMVMSVSAQSLAQQPSTQFQSTSSMVGSGSTLPQAASTGAYTTYDEGISSTPMHKSRILRSVDDDDNEDKPEGWVDPMQDPIGDGVWALMALAAGYAAITLLRKRNVKRLKR